MKTFEKKSKMTTPPVRRGRTPVLPSFDPAAQIQRAQIRQVLRSPQVQAKLTIGQPDDKYEREADYVADEVMRMPEPGVQRQVEPEEEEEEEPIQAKLAGDIQLQCQKDEPEEEEETLQAKPLTDQITPLVQRQVEPEEEEEEEAIQTKLADGAQVQRQEEPEEVEKEEPIQTKQVSTRAPAVTPNLASRIQSLKAGGQPLPKSARAFFEPRFGYDFSRVRVHTNIDAARVARLANAQALTVGQDIIFGAGHYASGTSLGRRLLAHELTHVIQQHKTASKQLQRKELHLYDPTDNFIRRWGYAKHYCANYSVITGMCLRRKPGKLHAAIYRVSDVGRMVHRFKVRKHKIKEIIFHTHGNKGHVHLSKGSLDISNVRLLAGVSNQLERNARIDFMGCNVGEGKKGLRFIQAVGNVLLRVGGGTVCASDSVTLSVPGLGQRAPLWTKAKCLFFAPRGRPRRP